MYRFFLQNNSIIVAESTEKEFRQKYPGSYELVGSIAEYDNIEKVLSRLKKDYRVTNVINDFQTLRRFGWKYFTEELQSYLREAFRKAKLGKPRPLSSNQKTSRTMKGKSNFQGKRHTPMTKIMIASSRYGRNPVKDMRWFHEPYSGKEIRCSELDVPPGFVLGRSPEFKDYIKTRKN